MLLLCYFVYLLSQCLQIYCLRFIYWSINIEFEDFEEEVNQALEYINTGAWLQLEGSVGRWCNGFLESGIIVKDQEKTQAEGPIKFTDGYGRHQEQYRFKIDPDRLDQVYYDTY